MRSLETLRSVVRFKSLETDLVERRLARAASVADLRRIARRRLPGGVFDYIDGAAEDERTLAANEAAFAVNSQFDPSLSWDDIDWLRSVWDGPIVVKGIQTVEDAVLAAERGVDAICLSNHGGRQLDDAPATFPLVAPVAEAVDGRSEIICDGGVRRGSDIVKAVAAGATAAMAGRAYLYALGAAGERGVDRVLDWFHSDIVRVMSLLGAGRVADLDPSLLEGDTTVPVRG